MGLTSPQRRILKEARYKNPDPRAMLRKSVAKYDQSQGPGTREEMKMMRQSSRSASTGPQSEVQVFLNTITNPEIKARFEKLVNDNPLAYDVDYLRRALRRI